MAGIEDILGIYPTEIRDASVQTGVPEEMIAAIIAQESQGNHKATSHKGAMGLMQLMPQTAAKLGVKNAYDPRQNINGGAAYFADLMNQFGDPTLALAAYNAGPGNVQKYGGIPPFKETQQYVSRITNNLNSYTPRPPMSMDEVLGGGPSSSPEESTNASTKIMTQPKMSMDDVLGELDYQLPQSPQLPEQGTSVDSQMVTPPAPAVPSGIDNVNKALSFAKGFSDASGGSMKQMAADKVLSMLGVSNPIASDVVSNLIPGMPGLPKTFAGTDITPQVEEATKAHPGYKFAGEMATALLPGGGVVGAAGKVAKSIVPKLSGRFAETLVSRGISSAAKLGTEGVVNTYLSHPDSTPEELVNNALGAIAGGAFLGGGAKVAGTLGKFIGEKLFNFSTESGAGKYAIDNFRNTLTQSGVLKQAEATALAHEAKVASILNNKPIMVDVGQAITPKDLMMRAKAIGKAGSQADQDLLESMAWALERNNGKLNVKDANFLKSFLWGESKFSQTGEAAAARSSQIAKTQGGKLKQLITDSLRKHGGPELANDYNRYNKVWGSMLSLKNSLQGNGDNPLKWLKWLKVINATQAVGTPQGALAIGKAGKSLTQGASGDILRMLGLNLGRGISEVNSAPNQ